LPAAAPPAKAYECRPASEASTGHRPLYRRARCDAREGVEQGRGFGDAGADRPAARGAGSLRPVRGTRNPRRRWAYVHRGVLGQRPHRFSNDKRPHYLRTKLRFALRPSQRRTDSHSGHLWDVDQGVVTDPLEANPSQTFPADGGVPIRNGSVGLLDGFEQGGLDFGRHLGRGLHL
jgi:hypothetical protein